MREGVLRSISNVFSLNPEEANVFLDVMSENTKVFPSPTYMEDILKKLPPPKYHIDTSTPVEENELNINMNSRSTGQGEYGYVQPNRSRQYIYKFISNPITPGTGNIMIRSILNEPLINIILQRDPVVKNSICRLYKLFCEKDNRGYTLIYKLEELGPTVYTLDNFFLLPRDVEINKRILLKTYGPIYKNLKHLRKTYSFEHGDLHSKNILFVKKPYRKDGTINEDRLDTKLIDFGLSGLVLDGKLYGGIDQFPTSIKQEVRHFFITFLPEDFKTQIKEIEAKYPGKGEQGVKRYLAIEDFVIQEYEKLIKPIVPNVPVPNAPSAKPTLLNAPMSVANLDKLIGGKTLKRRSKKRSTRKK